MVAAVRRAPAAVEAALAEPADPRSISIPDRNAGDVRPVWLQLGPSSMIRGFRSGRCQYSKTLLTI